MANRLGVLLLAGLWIISAAAAETTIKVGVYDYPPYAVETNQGFEGPTVALVKLLNEVQTRYHFVLTPTTARRRYKDFASGEFDVIFFEQVLWGWQNYPLLESQRFVSGGEIMITQLKTRRNQDYFNDITDKRLLGVLGYHYGFADFNSDVDYLTQTFSIHLVKNQQKVIELIVQEKADIGIVDKAYFLYYLRKHPEYRDELYYSEHYDQSYQHGALLREKGPIPLTAFNQMLQKLKQNGQLARLLQQYELDEFTSTTHNSTSR
ncbi:substrate-binding periplasmic protein [Saliniradius amylolyticus]|uniref:substrate-binding periplasmic protein n=1 Tax=Saliniradius amylolyticus TaxID=2183582 RepID=UPI0013A5A439|nr:transporter substrate-binding domain-containing protein [Saliniradius amylolyticus]